MAPPPAAAPSAGPGEFTRLVAAAPAESQGAPQAAASPTAAPASVAPPKATYLPLLLIGGFVLLVAIGLILYFALRH